MKLTTKTNFRIIVEPLPLGHFGGIRVPDNFGGLSRERVEQDYIDRCNEIVTDIKRHADNVGHCEVQWDTEITCSHCGNGWEESPDDEFPDMPKGCPLCCNKAMSEWKESNAATIR